MAREVAFGEWSHIAGCTRRARQRRQPTSSSGTTPSPVRRSPNRWRTAAPGPTRRHPSPSVTGLRSPVNRSTPKVSRCRSHPPSGIPTSGSEPHRPAGDGSGAVVAHDREPRPGCCPNGVQHQQVQLGVLGPTARSAGRTAAGTPARKWSRSAVGRHRRAGGSAAPTPRPGVPAPPASATGHGRTCLVRPARPGRRCGSGPASAARCVAGPARRGRPAWGAPRPARAAAGPTTILPRSSVAPSVVHSKRSCRYLRLTGASFPRRLRVAADPSRHITRAFGWGYEG